MFDVADLQILVNSCDVKKKVKELHMNDNFHFFQDYAFSTDTSDISLKVHNITKHLVLTVSDAVPSKYVSELTNCSTKSIFCLSVALFLY